MARILLKYKVLDTMKIGKNTVVAIEGNGAGLKNNMRILDESGVAHLILSVGMANITDKTILLVQGPFCSKEIIIEMENEYEQKKSVEQKNYNE